MEILWCVEKNLLFIKWENLHVYMIMKIEDIGNKVENCWSYILEEVLGIWLRVEELRCLWGCEELRH